MSTQPKGVGIHCFAGGFVMGVKQVLPVVGQLEIHNFGGETARKFGTDFMNADDWNGWYWYRERWDAAQFSFGNPRCTSFSSYSSGHRPEVRGPTAKPTQDIWDLCLFSVCTANLDLIAFESVQQCWTVGQPLIRRLIEEVFAPNDYRVAHLFVCTAAEGNPQKRKRYFFVAYRNDRPFNVYLPELPKYSTTVGDVLSKFEGRTTRECKLYGRNNLDYDADCHVPLTANERMVIDHLGQGEDLNAFARHHTDKLREVCPEYYAKWEDRLSELPFSLHCPTRVDWDGHCPTIASTSSRLIHSKRPRPLTVGEIAAMMGWPEGFIPAGADPVSQIGKGVVPATGAWLARQIKAYFDCDWGKDDFESKYVNGQLVGTDYTHAAVRPLEKTFNLTAYIPPLPREAA